MTKLRVDISVGRTMAIRVAPFCVAFVLHSSRWLSQWAVNSQLARSVSGC